MTFLTSIFDFFLPRFCPSCKEKLEAEEKFVCKKCMGKIKTADEDRILNEFKKKFEKEKIVSGFTSVYVFEKDKELQDIIHALKYNQKFLIGLFLGKGMASLRHIFKKWDINLVLPVPLHPLKKAERGYNQSYYIARALAAELMLPFDSGILKRVRFTGTQTTMSLKERKININGAFRTSSCKRIKGKNILLIDDVITTGATVSECGKVLLKSGAGKIFAASAAIAD